MTSPIDATEQPVQWARSSSFMPPTSAVDANVKSRLGEQTLAGKKLEL